MATALSSTRTGASRASAALLNSSAAKTSSYAGASRRSTQLAEEMHRRLYPQYYNENGRPKPSVRKGNKKFQKIKAPRRDVFVRWKGNQSMFYLLIGNSFDKTDGRLITSNCITMDFNSYFASTPNPQHCY